MSKDLQNAYDHIADDYLRKKEHPWNDFMRFVEMAELDQQSITLDVGAGNGRNLHGVTSSLAVAFDLSYELLQGYVGPEHGQRVAGALPHLPFRKNIASCVLSIAVVHHFRTPDNVIATFHDMVRVGRDAHFIVSVWRRWRRGLREKLYKAIRDGKNIEELINHDRPWYNSEREEMTTRFYHYYSFKELFQQIQKADLEIQLVKYLGGRHDDANIFVKLTHQS